MSGDTPIKRDTLDILKGLRSGITTCYNNDVSCDEEDCEPCKWREDLDASITALEAERVEAEREWDRGWRAGANDHYENCTFQKENRRLKSVIQSVEEKLRDDQLIASFPWEPMAWEFRKKLADELHVALEEK